MKTIEKPATEEAICPECLEKTTQAELIVFGGVCETCFETTS